MSFEGLFEIAIGVVLATDGALLAELKGREKVRLAAQSATNFAGFYGLGIQFVTDRQGVVTHLLDLVSSRFDNVVIDMPRTWFPWSDSVLFGSDHVFIVAEGTVPRVDELI